ncbi:MAG TPA: carbon starvation CstA family protein [Planctomycetota bacterium]|nr:carbon starvation CstA family protein [Planctomycetota bacterium]
MSLPLLVVAVLVLLALGYRLYGRWVGRSLGLDDTRLTPAHTRADGIDFVPARRFYLFGQHFSAIAAAGPIAGPILAAQAFGWVPCLLWIGFGVVLIGAVHDCSALAASVRHGGRSLAEMARELLGPRAGLAMLAFIWIALVYVISAFADITAGSFITGPEELAGVAVDFHPGGAVAAAAVMYLGLAVVMGLVQRLLSPPLWLLTLIFVPATFALVWAGTLASGALRFDRTTWGLLILLYCGISSVLPAWTLLQPRGYLGGFVLYVALAAGVIGVLFGGYAIEQPAFKGWDAGGAAGALLPFLFVTIACGACSGFHGLVCSGTTSKQIDKESHCVPVGYGAMLAEGFVAVIALVTIMIVAPAQSAGLAPGTIYGAGIGRFLSLVVGEERLGIAMVFGAMAFSTFVFDTLDVTTRLGRLVLQELSGFKGPASAVAATGLTLALPALLLVFAEPGGWRQYWTLFGASNQLLAGLTLLLVTVWLRRAGRRTAHTVLPMLFVLAITVWALGALVVGNWRASRGWDTAALNAGAAAAMLGLAGYLVAGALRGRSADGGRG